MTSRTSDEDLLVLTLAGCSAVIVATGSLRLWWGRALRWMIDHGILIGSKHHPLLVIPGSGGAGLDLSRLAVAAGVVALLLILGVAALVRVRARARQRALTSEGSA